MPESNRESHITINVYMLGFTINIENKVAKIKVRDYCHTQQNHHQSGSRGQGANNHIESPLRCLQQRNKSNIISLTCEFFHNPNTPPIHDTHSQENQPVRPFQIIKPLNQHMKSNLEEITSASNSNGAFYFSRTWFPSQMWWFTRVSLLESAISIWSLPFSQARRTSCFAMDWNLLNLDMAVLFQTMFFWN